MVLRGVSIGISDHGFRLVKVEEHGCKVGRKKSETLIHHSVEMCE